jgi:hypothetical protein
MLKTVKDSCKPHDMVFDFSMAEQVEDLGELIRSEADGEAFYAKNHVTGGMRTLFEMGCKRLAKQSDQSIFELTQAMGGGKTHTMIALGLLVKNDDLRTRVLGELGSRRRSPAGGLSPLRAGSILSTSSGARSLSSSVSSTLSASIGKTARRLPTKTLGFV